jgi:hypothetical protein
MTIGHARIYPPTSTGPIPPFNGYTNGLIRERNHDGQALFTIACTEAEHRWVCQQLAKRRGRLGAKRKVRPIRRNKNLQDRSFNY